jgi:F-type H+-transporting ATPase subunit a
VSLNALGTTLAALSTAGEGESHFPPSADEFWQPLIVLGQIGHQTIAITRPMVVMTLTVIGICVWLVTTSRRAAIVPSKGQWFTEQVYNFVRNDVARDMIGTKDFMKFVPMLFSMFVLILVNNWMGIIPPVQMPTMGRIGFPIALVLVVYVVYHWIGIKKHGLGGYFKMMIPPGLPGWLVPFILLLELLTFFVTRPLTLALRLFGNMFAGHLLLAVFIVGGAQLFASDAIGLKFVAIPAWILAFVMTLFEALVQFLQAYIFVLLAASYLGGALADEH